MTCNTVWQIPKSRCPGTLSAFATLREVCSHEESGCHRYPTPAPLPSHRKIDSDVQKRVPSMILFTCLIGLNWVAGRGSYGKGVGWGLLVGYASWGVLFRQRGESIGGARLTGGKKKHSHLISLLSYHGALCKQSNEVQITAQDC